MRHEHQDGAVPPDDADRCRDASDADRKRVTGALTDAAAAAGDARQVPAALCRACVALLPITGASVSLASGSTVRALWFASDETAARLAEAQYTLGDGPCQSALRLSAPVLAGDLTQGPDVGRWPVFAHQAVELGVRAAFSLPLGSGAQAIGTLDLYRDTPGALSWRELGIAMMVRDAVTFAVLNLGNGHPAAADPVEGGVASWMEAADADRTEVHQAVGMVMIQLGVDPEQALDRMRARAFVRGRTVSEVAHEIINRSYRFSREGDDQGPGDMGPGDKGPGGPRPSDQRSSGQRSSGQGPSDQGPSDQESGDQGPGRQEAGDGATEEGR
ncbi:GAF and ANTAR domain-containing protein [Streptomyces sp. TRM66268-LWL]|uniref:GAF and ANTAR domain-containing protein n=2 Tax=Streptomyces polyasparticus TaxID=2767826 RepID=A0ABR7SIC8_9ACTN|nr:GAF and ANTAR domain-containing protein [Streptomyces polyasparticus]